jgi:hypothetical protein
MLHTEKKDKEREGEWRSKKKGGALETIKRTAKKNVCSSSIFPLHSKASSPFLLTGIA